jgi:hypothetical protein
MRRNRKGKADIHSATISFDRRIDEFLQISESDDFFELFLDVALSHAKDGAVQGYVLASGQLPVKTSADLEKAPDPPAEPCPA